MKVFVYWNFNKKLWSLRSLVTKRIVGYRHKLCLRDCTFKVSQAGRNRVLQEKRKNVHAGIIGTITRRKNAIIPVSYNPYKYEKFVNKYTLLPVEKAQLACFTADGKCMIGENYDS